ncbi:MAG: DUF4118 domain-containing protein [Anaerolineales bacterium]|nr:DUF4118 domain-containing protein [Anaerolineales bacterium]
MRKNNHKFYSSTNTISPSSLSRRILPYFFVLLFVGICAGIFFPFRSNLNPTTLALIFLIPVLICTTWWGFGPGITSAFLTFLVYNFFFLTPYYTFTVHHSEDIISLGIFLIIAVLISQLVGRSKKSLDLAITREQELSRLYELSLSLTGANNPEEAADVVAHKIRETIPSCQVAVTVTNGPFEKPLHVSTRPCDNEMDQEPTDVFPLESGRGQIGEIRLWKSGESLSPSENRLMEAFSAQCAIALERAGLTQAESRSQVLEESDRLKSALLSSVSHELRTPLATIKAFVTSLLSEQVSWDGTERKELLTAMNEETDHLNRLVGNLLDMSRIESGAMKPNRKWNQISEIAEAAASRLKKELNNYTLSLDLPEDLPLVPVDYMQIEQVFTNLLSNSAKYSPNGSTIWVKAQTIYNENKLLVQVINEGPPVKQEDLDQIFTKFYRVTNSEKVSGTGLGLSICKGIIEAHGGQIWAENLPSTFAFKFLLPLQVDGMAPPVINLENL